MDKHSNGPYTYTGVIVSVGERQAFGTKGFAKRDFMISADPDAEYPKFLQLTLKTGKVDHTEDVAKNDVGRTVTASFFLETRKWESKATGKTGFATEATCVKVVWDDAESSAPEPAEPDADLASDPDDFPF